MTEYEQWGDSRWEFTKNQSSWHFDPSVPPTPGHDSYTHVCRFTNDFTQEIVKCLPEAKASTWSSRNNYDKKIEEEGEGAPANVTGAGVSTDIPLPKKKDLDKYKQTNQAGVVSMARRNNKVM